jgi:TM2 domain-containing membrane protein YozV
MNEANFCVHCGNKLQPGSLFCPKCGAKIGATTIESQATDDASTPTVIDKEKLGKTALILCALFGMLGVHRFYVGKIWTGAMMLVTGGFLGVWVVIDLIAITRNKFEDKNGNQLELIHNITPIKETILVSGAVMLWVGLFFTVIAIFLRYSTSGLVAVVNGQLTALQNGQIDQAYAYTAQSYQRNNSVDAFKNFVYAHPALINNTSSYLPDRQIINNSAFVRGTLTAKDGVETTVVYQLVKENGEWKIININIVITPPDKDNPSK